MGGGPVAKFRSALLTAALAGSGFLIGCGGGGDYFAGVTVGPPAPLIYGPVGVAPGPGYVWTDGFYVWDGGGWRWRDGRWARRPYPRARWIHPRYERRGHGYRMYPGHWDRDRGRRDRDDKR